MDISNSRELKDSQEYFILVNGKTARKFILRKKKKKLGKEEEFYLLDFCSKYHVLKYFT